MSGNLKNVGPLSRQIGWNLKDREAQQQEEVLLQASGENWKKKAIFPCSTNEMQRMLFGKPVFFVQKIPERDAFETSSTLQQIMPITAHEAVKDEQARRERAWWNVWN